GRGNGDGTAFVNWLGDHPVYPGGGYITFSAGYVDPANNVFRSFPTFSQYCYHFTPGTPPGGTSTGGRPTPPPPPPNPPFYRWQPASNGAVPPGAVIVTQGPLYLCRASFHGGIYPGNVVRNSCNFSAGNQKENAAPNYEVLTAQNGEYSLDWQSSRARPATAV